MKTQHVHFVADATFRGDHSDRRREGAKLTDLGALVVLIDDDAEGVRRRAWHLGAQLRVHRPVEHVRFRARRDDLRNSVKTSPVQCTLDFTTGI